MPDTVPMPSPRVARKVQAATGGSATGTAIALVLAWAYQQLTGHDMPADVALVLAGLLSTALAWIAGYVTKAHVQDVLHVEVKPVCEPDAPSDHA